MIVDTLYMFFFFFFKKRTAYELRIRDWSSDVCSPDLGCTAKRRKTKCLSRARNSRPAREVLLESPRLRTSERGNAAMTAYLIAKSEERRVGKECVSTCRSRWSTYH